jgi:hypothetical protein
VRKPSYSRNERGAHAVVNYRYSRKDHKWVTTGWELQRAWGPVNDIRPEIYDVMKNAFGEAQPRSEEP